MKARNNLQVAAPPERPVLVYDGDCHFCQFWVRRGQQITGTTVDYRPAQEPQVRERFPEIPAAAYDEAVQLIDTNGRVSAGAAAVMQALAFSPTPGWRYIGGLAPRAPGFMEMAEAVYRCVASHRPFFSRLTRWLWGRQVETAGRAVTAWVFLRMLGIIYLVAFISLGQQVEGLIGPQGIEPANGFMTSVQTQCDAQGVGWQRYLLAPTLGWLGTSAGFLKAQCIAGGVAAGLLILDVAPAICLALLWLLYLSLATLSQDFLSFQWDNLLLEAGFLAIFLAPWRWRPAGPTKAEPSRLMSWMLRLLLFKLMFSSGCVKLLSHDPNWRNLTALTFHYQTQPLPTWLAWYANELPLWFQKASCAVMFVIELGAPWLVLGPRRIRFLGAAAIASLQCLILVTGNYTFFNYLTLALCLLCLDDFAIQSVLPARFCRDAKGATPPGRRPPVWLRWATIPVAAVFLVVSMWDIVSMFDGDTPLLRPAAYLAAEIAPLRTVNSYGLFAVMTTTRDEIIVQGSDDGSHWQDYEFKFKPGDVRRAPGFVAPFQPRLDWQMWFAALGTYQQNPWFGNFCERLLQGSPPVLALLKTNPFPGHPPKLIRAEFYAYRFTDAAGRRESGAWWQRELVGEYLPPVSLRSDAESP